MADSSGSKLLSSAPAPGSLLTEAETAAYLRIDPDTLRVWRSKSRRAGGNLIGPAWRALGGGRLIRYLAEDIADYVRGAKPFAAVAPTAPAAKRRGGRPRKAIGGAA